MRMSFGLSQLHMVIENQHIGLKEKYNLWLQWRWTAIDF